MSEILAQLASTRSVNDVAHMEDLEYKHHLELNLHVN